MTKQQHIHPNTAKRIARLVAVQVLYQASFGEETPADIIKNTLNNVSDVLNGDEGDEGERGALIAGSPDQDLLNDIVFGVEKNKPALEEMLISALDSRFTFGRMEVLLRTLLMAGAYELFQQGKTDSPIIISDYVDVARSFFNAKEPGLVNAVLDRLSKVLRA